MRITELVVNGRTYQRRQGRSVNRWTYMPNNGHPRVWVHRTSRLHHALERLAEAEEHIYELHTLLTEMQQSCSPKGDADVGVGSS